MTPFLTQDVVIEGKKNGAIALTYSFEKATDLTP